MKKNAGSLLGSRKEVRIKINTVKTKHTLSLH